MKKRISIIAGIAVVFCIAAGIIFLKNNSVVKAEKAKETDSSEYFFIPNSEIETNNISPHTFTHGTEEDTTEYNEEKDTMSSKEDDKWYVDNSEIIPSDNSPHTFTHGAEE